MSKSSFVGTCFLTTKIYRTPSGVYRAGIAGDVLDRVGSNSYLIQNWDEEWEQMVVPASFFIDTNARIFDSFDEMKVGVKAQ